MYVKMTSPVVNSKGTCVDIKWMLHVSVFDIDDMLLREKKHKTLASSKFYGGTYFFNQFLTILIGVGQSFRTLDHL